MRIKLADTKMMNLLVYPTTPFGYGPYTITEHQIYDAELFLSERRRIQPRKNIIFVSNEQAIAINAEVIRCHRAIETLIALG